MDVPKQDTVQDTKVKSVVQAKRNFDGKTTHKNSSPLTNHAGVREGLIRMQKKGTGEKF